MKKVIFEKIGMLFLILVCSFIGVDTTMAIAGTPLDTPLGGTQVSSEGVAGVGTHTTAAATVGDAIIAGEEYLSDFDRQVVKILPFRTPIDTLFRYSQKRSVKSYKTEWASVDTPATSTTLSTTHTQASPLTSADAQAELTVANAAIFIPGNTILVPTVLGWDKSGNRETEVPLQLYVKSKSGSKITVMAINGPSIPNTSRDNMVAVPTISSTTQFVRMGTAFHEMDVQCTPQSVYSSTEYNYLQTFKCQVEVSNWFEDMNKLVDWTRADEKEMAKLNYKMEMEFSYLLGVRGSIYDDTKKGNGRVYTCNGIIRYIGKEYEYTNTGWTKDDFIDLAKKAFVGNIGSEKRIAFVGSDLLAEISKVDFTLMRDITKSTKVLYGITFTSFVTNFGEVLIRHHEMLDKCGMSDQGFLIDPDMLFKYVYEAENDQEIDNKELGVSNSKATVTTETSCPGLKNPDCHLVIKKGSAS